MTRKQFDAALFEANDLRARAAVADHLSLEGRYISPNPDKYGPDLQVYTGYRLGYYVECEIKRVWNPDESGSFPWDTVQIPERKRKLAEQVTKPVEFWILSGDCKWAIVFSEETMLSSPLVEVPNKLVQSGEKFFQIPIGYCNLLKLGE